MSGINTVHRNMSKNSTDTVELQRIISSNGSAMSTSESLTHTDMSPMGPLYSTVPEAKTAHTNYHQMQKKSNSPPSYQAPGEGEVPNEYDVIPDKQQQSRRLMRSVSPVVVADNVLYGDQNAADQMKHKALTMERGEEFQNKYSGNTSRPLPSDSKDDDYMIKCKCQTFCFTIVLLVVFLVAVAALVLVLIIMLGVYSVCDCNASACKYCNTLI